MRTLAHLSDLHLGQSQSRERRARALVEALLRHPVDHLVVTGDITHKGRTSELALFEDIFAPLRAEGRLTVVPGNHDRLGDDVGGALMGDAKVSVAHAAGLFLLRLDSTGDHNQSYLHSYGELSEETIQEVEERLQEAPPRALRVLLLHHHLLPTPEDSIGEWLVTRLGSAHSAELTLGERLLERLAGRCDLVLHGHRHVPRVKRWSGVAGSLLLTNAGSSTELGQARLFKHAGGALVGEPTWLSAAKTPAPAQAQARIPSTAAEQPRAWEA